MSTMKATDVLALAVLLSASFHPAQMGSEEFEIKSITPAVKVAWEGDWCHAFQAWRAMSPEGPWEKVGAVLDGFDGDMCIYDDVAGGRQFYRIEASVSVPPGMVPVPGGTYEMGDHFGTGAQWESPVHTVRVDSFFMDAKEVTNAEYCTFLNALAVQGLLTYQSDTGEVEGPVPSGTIFPTYVQIGPSKCYIVYDEVSGGFSVEAGKTDHPVVGVRWIGAVSYCNWRSEQEGLTSWFDLRTGCVDFAAEGYRLPTEAEWEYAARGDLRYTEYPWGNSWDGAKANFHGSGDPYEEERPATTPVGYYPPNSYGLFDMAGNAAEHCYDLLDKNYYLYCFENAITDNPIGPDAVPTEVTNRAVRGGSWETPPRCIRCAWRGGTGREGFRCVRRPKRP